MLEPSSPGVQSSLPLVYASVQTVEEFLSVSDEIQ